MPLIRKEPAKADASQATTSPSYSLSSALPEERWAAARLLGGRPADVQPLASALRTESDPRVREAILTGLARAATAESVEAVLPLLRSDSADLRTGALDALRAMPAAAGARLPDLLADADPDVRVLACELARALPSAAAQQILCDLLGREHQVNVCAAAIEVLAEVGDSTSLRSLQRCAERFPDEPFLCFSIRLTTDRIRAERA